MRGGLLVTGLLTVIACGSSQTSPNRPMGQIAEDGGFLGWRLGGAFTADDRFEPTKRDRKHRLRQPVTIGGRAVNDVFFEHRDGVLTGVELSLYADGKPAADDLLGWAEKLCAPFTDRLEWMYPSPLGTPEPGEDWDPVQSENADCSGEAHGVRYSISLSRNSASDFENANVSVRLRPPATKRP